MELFTSLLFLMVSARLLGHLARRLRQPSIFGELAAGFLLGPSVLNLVSVSEPLKGIAGLAIFFIVLSAGLEMKFADVFQALGPGLRLALASFMIPFLGGLLLGVAFGYAPATAVALGLCMSITALPVAARILNAYGLLSSRIGRLSIACAVLNDIIALMLMGLLLDLPPQARLSEGARALAVAALKVAMLAGTVLAIEYGLRRVLSSSASARRIQDLMARWFGAEAIFGAVILFVLTFASLSETLGFHSVIGAFFGGLLISRDLFVERQYRELEHALHSVSRGFLSPLFFATLGLEFSLAEMPSPFFVVLAVLLSATSKFAAGFYGGRFIGLSREESIGLGYILNGRGVMELVVAQIALDRGFVDLGLFSALVAMGVVTTAVTPFLFGAVADAIRQGRVARPASPPDEESPPKPMIADAEGWL